MTVPTCIPRTINKYRFQILAVCCITLLIYSKHYFVESDFQNTIVGKIHVYESNQDESLGEAELIKTVDAIENNRVDPRTLSRYKTEQILRDSIESFHSNHFIKPPNEVCKKRPPSAIVIGVAKSGTRELLDFLHLHPHVQIWHRKVYEMQYFVQRQIKGTEWLTEKMPCSFSNQMTIMKHSGLFHRNNVDVPERIRTFNASIKLILIVREPISRSYSAYSFLKTKRRGNKYPPFDQIVIGAMTNKTQKRPKILNMSIYDESMERWLKVFNQSQILIIEHNEFKQDPVSVLVKVEGFLGLGHYITPDMFVYNKETGFQCIRSTLTTTGMACYANNRGRTQEPLSAVVKSTLTEFFKQKNERFFRLIGKTFDW